MGRSTQVRRGYHIGQLQQGVIRRQWFLDEDVQGGAGDVAGVQGLGQVLLIDDAAASAVENPAPLLHLGQLGRSDEVSGLGRQRGVDGEDVAAGQDLVERRDTFDAELGGPFLGQEGIETNHLHVQAHGSPSHLTADASQADDAERLAGQLSADKLAFLPFAAVQAGVGRRNVPGQGHHHGDGVLRRADGVASRRVHDQDAAPGGGGHVDVVDADARPHHDSQFAGILQHSGGDLCIAADHHPIGRLDRLDQGVPFQSVALVQLEACLAQEIEAGSLQFVTNENAHHGSPTTRSYKGTPGPTNQENGQGPSPVSWHVIRLPASLIHPVMLGGVTHLLRQGAEQQ